MPFSARWLRETSAATFRPPTHNGAERLPPHSWNLPATELSRGVAALVMRSEEHTSELKSLMRISYAVFCSKKKTTLLRLVSSVYCVVTMPIHTYTNLYHLSMPD